MSDPNEERKLLRAQIRNCRKRLKNVVLPEVYSDSEYSDDGSSGSFSSDKRRKQPIPKRAGIKITLTDSSSSSAVDSEPDNSNNDDGEAQLENTSEATEVGSVGEGEREVQSVAQSQESQSTSHSNSEVSDDGIPEDLISDGTPEDSEEELFEDSVSENSLHEESLPSDDSLHTQSSQSAMSSDSEHDELLPSDAEDEDEQAGNAPLYPGARLTIHESLLVIFTLATMAHITGELLAQILTLIALHCPLNSNCITTLYKFKKYFLKVGKSIINFHYFCSNCIFPVKSKNSECPKCHKFETSFFLEIPILHQLQSLFRRRYFYEDLQYRFNPNRKKNKDNIEDMFDGEIYKEEMANGFLNNPNNISFMAYTDGLRIFRSSSFSVWPLYLVINELPYKKRIQPCNIILFALWCGKTKPSPNVFMRPLKESLDKFCQTGYHMKLHNGNEILVKGKILCFTCDLPAKSKFLNFKQYNGYYGCPSCLAPGKEIKLAPRSSVHVYPYPPNYPPRTHSQTRRCAKSALKERKTNKDASVQGVKGATLLYHMMPDLIKCLAIDIMHGVFLGIAKLLVTLWFSSPYSRMPWTLYDYVDEIDARLKQIKVPSFVQRFPRSVKDVALWKASEFKLFLMYYSIPVFEGLMSNEYLHHLCKLISGISLLSQDSISFSQLETASNLLQSFVADFSTLYDVRFLGINVHQLLHLADIVRYLGPLWVYSCFFLESLNGGITRLVHGTQHVALQICTSASMYMHLPILVDKLPQNSMVYEFCKRHLRKGRALKIAAEIGEDTFAIGTYKTDFETVENSKLLLGNKFRIVNGCVKHFYRLKKNGILFFCQEYSRKSVRKESSYVTLTYNRIPYLGRLIRFVKWSQCQPQCPVLCDDCPSEFYFVLQKYERQFWVQHQFEDIRMSYLSKVCPTDQFDVFPVESLKYLCFYTKVGENEFIALPINNQEIE